MERLTKKHDGSGSYTQFGDKYIPNHNIRHKQCVEKLGKLEDIEEKLGIPLEVLFKALKDGVYYDYKHREPEDIAFRLCYKELIVRYTCFGEIDYDYLEFKDYGKTWALTEEELE